MLNVASVRRLRKPLPMPPEGLVKRRLAALYCSLVMMLASPAMAQTAPAPAQSDDALASLVRSKIKHVFVIYQENRSFDSYFGTYPGAENLSSAFASAAG